MYTKILIELKTCPFCGSNKVGLLWEPSPTVTCNECSAEGPIGSCKDDAYKRWNKRSDLTGDA